MVLTAKHHDGFCLWPSRTTAHTVARSPWRAGAGDVVREFVDACRAERLRPGLYLSPWDRNNPAYGDSPRYNDLYCEQLTELLTNYGPLAEVWFDGANGEGPNGKKQEYDWPRVWALVRKLQPNAVMFSDAGPDVRWCGNEHGSAGDPNWSMVDPSAVPYPGISGRRVIASLQHGDPAGTVWRPAEADTSIRPGWFYHPAEDARVLSVDALVDLYYRSVGRNAKLLLNVPPTRDGLAPQDRCWPARRVRRAPGHAFRKRFRRRSARHLVADQRPDGEGGSGPSAARDTDEGPARRADRARSKRRRLLSLCIGRRSDLAGLCNGQHDRLCPYRRAQLFVEGSSSTRDDRRCRGTTRAHPHPGVRRTVL